MFSKNLFLNFSPIKLFEDVIYHSEPQRIGKTTTVAALASIVKKIKFGIFGSTQTKGEYKHQKITILYNFELLVSNWTALIGFLDAMTLVASKTKYPNPTVIPTIEVKRAANTPK